MNLLVMNARCPSFLMAGARPRQTKVYFGRSPVMSRYVAYFRVSTAAQGRSGLGLAAQRSKIEAFLNADDEVIAEFVEVEQLRRQRFAAGMPLTLLLVDAQPQLGGFRHSTKLPLVSRF